ncbi:DUF2505 domain-containing protein [Nocardia sp. NPDC005366]|uniref:DUF2505 domain-containing protein n=1 Tax=Nocardia sp. NPDC005366 TaxID=3156878 RepID=UPI0033B7B8EE
MSKNFADEYLFPYPVDAVHRALFSREHWACRLAQVGDQATTMTGFTASPGQITVTASTEIAGALLPPGAARNRDITFDFEEEWHDLDGDIAHGVMRASIKLARMRLDGTFRLRARGLSDSVMRFEGEVTSKLPVFGRAVEDGVCTQIIEGFTRNCDFIQEWVGLKSVEPVPEPE